MAVVPIRNLKYLGDAPNIVSLMPSCGFPGKSNGGRYFNLRKAPPAPPLLNNAIQPSTVRKVLGKENPNARILVSTPPPPSTDGMYPKQGIARHQKKGLAYAAIPSKRVLNGPIMPLADSRFAFANNKLGQPS